MIASFLITSLIRVKEGMRFAFLSNTMSCIEAEQESSDALQAIRKDL